MSNISHLALFFKGKDPGVLYWVRAALPREKAQNPAKLALLVTRSDGDLEHVLCGSTEYACDDEYWQEGNTSKRLVYVGNCHMEAYAAAFGGNSDEYEDEFVRRNTQRIGFIIDGEFQRSESEVVERVPVTPTSIPTEFRV